MREIEEIQEFSVKKPKIIKRPAPKTSLWEKTMEFILTVTSRQKLSPFWQARQAFFLRNMMEGRSFLIPPHSNLTIDGALVFYPLQEKIYNFTLIIKNNLTGLYFLPLTGKGELSRLVVTKIRKANFGFFLSFYENRNFYREEERNRLAFDLEMQDFECLFGSKYEISRIFTVKNIGNMVVNVKKVSIEQCGCYCHGFHVVNCTSFAVKPNEEFDIMVLFYPDLIEGNKKKRFLLFFNDKVEVFWLEVNYPAEILNKIPNYNYYYNDLLPQLEKIRVLTILASLLVIYRVFSRFLQYFKRRKEKIEFNHHDGEDLNVLKLSKGIIKFKNSVRKVRLDMNFLENKEIINNKNEISGQKYENSNKDLDPFMMAQPEKSKSSLGSSKSDEVLDSDAEIIGEEEIKQGFFGNIGEKATKKMEKSDENAEKQYLYNYFRSSEEKSQQYSLLLGQYLSSSEENKLGESEYGEESSFTSETSMNNKFFGKKNK